jgi:hypothetical protein
MGNGGEKIKDIDPPFAGVVDGAAAVDVVAGGLLLAFSETIHNVIGAGLIAFGLFLFYYSRTHLIRGRNPSSK